MFNRKVLTIVPFLLMGCASLGSSRPLTLPFDNHADQVMVEGSVEGSVLHLLLDTAVDPSAIDRGAASRLGLKHLGGEGAVEGAGNDVATAFESILPTLTVGDRSFGPISILVNDMSKLQARYGAQLDGVLGYSLLKDHAVLIDYPANQVSFYDGTASREPRRCAKVYRFPLRFQSDEERLIIVPGLRIGGIEVPALLDTGSSSGLRIEADAPKLAALKPMLPPGDASRSVGARGEETNRRGTLTVPVTLGPFRVDNADFSTTGVRNADVPVNIGNRTLRSMSVRLLVDIPGKRVGFFGDCA